MNRHRWEGAGRKFTGSLKIAAGRIAGSRRLQIEGAMERAAGGAQSALGRMQDRLTPRPASARERGPSVP